MNTDQQERAAYQDAMLNAAIDDAAALKRRAEQAEADAAALWGCLSALVTRGLGSMLPYQEDADRVQQVLVDHPGAALLAELDAARAALDQIDRHVIGACASETGGMPEPCEECGDMREIAKQALQSMKEARAD